MCIFFFKQKTAYEMRISDWSSDVCSSDLAEGIAQVDDQLGSALRLAPAGLLADAHQEMQRQRDAAAEQDGSQRQLDRKTVVSGKSVLVRVDIGGRRIIKKKQPLHDHMKKNTN